MENEDFIIESGILEKYVGASDEVVVPEGVTEIRASAFSGRPTLTSLVLPEGITLPPFYGLSPMPALRELSIPSSIEAMDQDFRQFENLRFNCYQNGNYVGNEKDPYLCFAGPTGPCGESFTLHPDTKVISAFAFNEARELKRLTVPNGVRYIGREAFRKCVSLTEVVLPESLTRFGFAVFQRCTALKNVTLPSALTSINGNAFRGCGELTEIKIPASVKKLESYAFSGCRSLRTVLLPDGLEEIGLLCFDGCRELRRIDLPKGLKYIDTQAFRDCASLREITLPDGLEKISEQAFLNCKELTSVTGNAKLRYLGEMAFGRCVSLSRIRLPVPERPGYLKSVKSPFYKCPRRPHWFLSLTNDPEQKLAAVLGWLEDEEREADPAMLRYVRENHREIIAQCIKRKEVIALGALIGEVLGDELTIDEVDEAIDLSEDAAIRSTLLTYKRNHYTQDDIERYADDKVDVALGLKEPSAEEVVKLLTLDSRPEGYFVTNYRGELTALRIPPYVNGTPVVGIDSNAFRSCEFTSLTLPDTLRTIKESAFRFCIELTSLEVPEGVKTFHFNAFFGCNELHTVILPSTLERVVYDRSCFLRSFNRLIYRGTVEQWKKLRENSTWNSSPIEYLECSDGVTEA